ncbi:MAG: mechanosensitive ion channel domain-containing protein [Cyanobacteria bacterium P01_E01_bin.45]
MLLLSCTVSGLLVFIPGVAAIPRSPAQSFTTLSPVIEVPSPSAPAPLRKISTDWASRKSELIAAGVPPISNQESEPEDEAAPSNSGTIGPDSSSDRSAPSEESSTTPAAVDRETSVAEGNDSGYVTVGDRQIFALQPFAAFSGQDRADLVTIRISEFFKPDANGRIREPRVTAEFDPNGQHIIRLSERNESPGADTSIDLLTVTRSDVAAARDIEPADVTVAEARRITREWAQRLEPVLREEWDLERARQQRRQPLSIALGVISAAAIGAMAYILTKLSDRAVRYMQRRVAAKSSQNWEFLIDLGASCCKWALRLLVAASAIHFSLSVLPILAVFQQQLYQRVSLALVAVWAVFNRPLLPNSSVSALSIAAFIVLASFIFTAARRLSDGIKQQLLSRLIEDVGSRESISIVLKYLVTALGILIALPLIGIDLGSLAIATGAVGLGIGIGLQNLSRNFISGIVMLFERPIQVGDFVDVDGLQGTIEHINLRATIVRTLDSINVIVPNSRFMEENVVSWSYRDSRCRLHIPVGVAYGSDTETVKYALLKVASDQPRVLKSPAPQVFFKGFGDSSLNFDLMVWTLRPADQFKLVSDLNFAIDAEFRKEAIEIPFPQRDINIRTTAVLEQLLTGGQSSNGHLAPDHPSVSSEENNSQATSTNQLADSEANPDP